MSQDPRVARTEEAIHAAFIHLVEEKGFAHVSVKDICERAEINRNTFYLHYTDKEALMSRILEDVIAMQAMQIASVASHLASASPGEVEEIVGNILSYLSREIVFYRILFTDTALQSYVRHLYRTAFEMVSLGARAPLSPVTLSYLINGFIGVVTEWLTHPTDSVADIVPILSRLLVSTLPLLHG